MITGSRNWPVESNLTIKNFIISLRKKYDIDTIQVISAGLNEGVDSVVKKYSLHYDFHYGECRPRHMLHGMYCIDEPKFYNRTENHISYFSRNTELTSLGDIFVFFMSDEDFYVTELINKVIRKKKKYVIFNHTSKF